MKTCTRLEPDNDIVMPMRMQRQTGNPACVGEVVIRHSCRGCGLRVLFDSTVHSAAWLRCTAWPFTCASPRQASLVPTHTVQRNLRNLTPIICCERRFKSPASHSRSSVSLCTRLLKLTCATSQNRTDHDSQPSLTLRPLVTHTRLRVCPSSPHRWNLYPIASALMTVCLMSCLLFLVQVLGLVHSSKAPGKGRDHRESRFTCAAATSLTVIPL